MTTLGLSESKTLENQTTGSLDFESPAEQMRAVGATPQQYFEAKDWLRRRNKEFPGLVK